MPKKLSAKELETFRQVLLLLKAEISGDIDTLETDALASDGSRASVDNPADVGSDSFAQEFSLGLLARDEATLGEVIEALGRLEKGEFGRCEVCGNLIQKGRLQAVPYARNCVRCQRELELDD
jgi:RNA polymerase-binding transcription factor DksA